MSEFLTKNLVTIDLNSLDRECQRQPRICRKVAVDLLPRAKKILATLEARLELVKAECSIKVRKNPKKYGSGKATEGAIKEAVATMAAYQKAKRMVINAQHDVDVLIGSLTTIAHKKSMIESAVQMHGQGYFARPRVDERGKAALNGHTRIAKSDGTYLKRRRR